MKNSPEIKILIPAENLILPEVKVEREQLVVQAAGIKSISTQTENEIAGKSVVAMRKHVRTVNELRLSQTRILDDAKKLFKDYSDEHCEILIAEIERLQKLGNNFIESENRRVAAEEKKRADDFATAQKAQFSAETPVQEMIARRKVQNIIAVPRPEVEKAKGQSFKQVLKHRVIDLHKIYKCRPELVRLEINVSAVNSTCHPNIPVDGLELYFENQTTYTTR